MSAHNRPGSIRVSKTAVIAMEPDRYFLNKAQLIILVSYSYTLRGVMLGTFPRANQTALIHLSHESVYFSNPEGYPASNQGCPPCITNKEVRILQIFR